MGEIISRRHWLLVAAVAIVVQEAASTYSEPGPGPHLVWGGLSLWLLHRAGRGGSLAWSFLLTFAAIGAILFGIQLTTEGRQLTLVAAYVVQVTALLAISPFRTPRKTTVDGVGPVSPAAQH